MWKKVLTSTTPIPEEIQTSFDIGPDKMSHISFNTRDLKFIDHQNDQNDIGGHHVLWLLEFCGFLYKIWLLSQTLRILKWSWRNENFEQKVKYFSIKTIF